MTTPAKLDQLERRYAAAWSRLREATRLRDATAVLLSRELNKGRSTLALRHDFRRADNHCDNMTGEYGEACEALEAARKSAGFLEA